MITVEEASRLYVDGMPLHELAKVCGVAADSVRRDIAAAGTVIRRPGAVLGNVNRGGRETRHCKGDRCSNTFVVQAASNKRYCSPPCRYSDSALAAIRGTMIESRHLVTDVDEAARRGVCSICGPVTVRLRRGEQRVYGPARNTWRCKVAERARDWARKYGLTPEEVFARLRDQDGKCLICRYVFNEDFYVDHCHSTDRIRGLLCSTCNLVLGTFGDDAERFRAAAAYLERP